MWSTTVGGHDMLWCLPSTSSCFPRIVLEPVPDPVTELDPVPDPVPELDPEAVLDTVGCSALSELVEKPHKQTGEHHQCERPDGREERELLWPSRPTMLDRRKYGEEHEHKERACHHRHDRWLDECVVQSRAYVFWIVERDSRPVSPK